MLNLQGWKTQQVRFRNNWKWVQMIPHIGRNFKNTKLVLSCQIVFLQNESN